MLAYWGKCTLTIPNTVDTGCDLCGRGESILVGGGGVAQGRMKAPAIVEALDLRQTPWFDEPEEGRARRLSGVERDVAIQFRLEAAEDALH